MNKSIFQVAGPIMIGPSSSHTAGAAKLGRLASQLVDSFDSVSFGLHGSFAKTGKGHGTDKALVAGVLGLREDNEAMIDSFSLAEKAQIKYEFFNTILSDIHENSVIIKFFKNSHCIMEVEGSSIGGGEVLISKINGYKVELVGNIPTIFIIQKDTCGVISHVATVLAEAGINIATMKVSRMRKSEDATCLIEVDHSISDELLEKIKMNINILSVRLIML